MSIPGWQDVWSLQIEVIDAEHRLLVETLGDLARRFTLEPGGAPEMPRADAAESVRQHDALIAALEGLGAQAREHFQHEEAFMRSIDYPDLGAHRSEHSLLLAEYIEMVRDLAPGPVTRLDPETVSALRAWLVGHILGPDRELADHYFALLETEDASA